MSDRLPNGRFPPGVSGNPGGMTKGRSITKVLRRLLDDDKETWDLALWTESPEGSKAEGVASRIRLALNLYRRAQFDMAAMRELLERVDGKLAAAYALPDDDGAARIIQPVLYVAPEKPEQVAGLVDLFGAASPLPEGWDPRPALTSHSSPFAADAGSSEPMAVLIEVAPESPKDRK